MARLPYLASRGVYLHHYCCKLCYYLLSVIYVWYLCWALSVIPLSAKRAPVRHQLMALGQHVAAAVGGFDLVADGMRERHFQKLVRIAADLCAPVSERRSETVRHCINAQALKTRCIAL